MAIAIVILRLTHSLAVSRHVIRSVRKTAEGTVVTLGTVSANPLFVWETFYHSISLFFTVVGVLTPAAGEVLMARGFRADSVTITDICS